MPAKPKPLTEAQFLALLDKALAATAADQKLRAAIQDAVAKEIRVARDVAAFNIFCETGSVPDVSAGTVADLQASLAATFGSDAKVEITPPPASDLGDESLAASAESPGALDVEIVLPDRTITSKVKVRPGGMTDGDDDAKVPFVPFPVALPTDAELVWSLARREDLGPDEAGRALARLEEEHWASKAGQMHQRKGGDKTFAEFIANVPSAALLDAGLKRHYKEPEKMHSLQPLSEGGAGASGDFAPDVDGPRKSRKESKTRAEPAVAPREEIVFLREGESDPAGVPW